SADEVGAILTKIQDETGVGISGYLQEKSADVCAFEVSVGDAFAEIPVEILDAVFKQLEADLPCQN
ncbi:low specificity L-threonine aldolase, partial [Listeria monocytogenes]|nr:low specificity L-threonine aldolase [Listeria monocytogenes]